MDRKYKAVISSCNKVCEYRESEVKKMKKTYFIKFTSWLEVTRQEFKAYVKRGYIGRVAYEVTQ